MADTHCSSVPAGHELARSRREALRRMCALAALQAPAAWLAGCGGGGGDGGDGGDAGSPPAPAAPMPPPPAPPGPPPEPASLTRLKTALERAPLGPPSTSITVTQGMANSAASSFGASAMVLPAFDTVGESLATIPQLWGHRRELWVPLGGAVIEGHTVYPVQRQHRAATMNSVGVCDLQFEFDGAAFEILFAGSGGAITLLADGSYQAPAMIRTTLGAGAPGMMLSQPNTFVRFDFGVAAPRRISVYAWSSQGPCALAIGAGDSLQAWDRSDEASFAAMSDSYGGANGPDWRGGPFWEAAALLGVPRIDLDAIGGTGYAPVSTNADTLNPGNAFGARLASITNGTPDLFLTAGGINDNNSLGIAPYATPAEARAGFDAAVARYFSDLRAALPDAVLVALGPWAPKQATPTDPVAFSKADTIEAALVAAGGLWVFLDNLRGGWRNSAGASAPASGPWQTGTGNSAAPTGDGNGDLYLSADGVHPNEAGCRYLGGRIASDLRAALRAL